MFLSLIRLFILLIPYIAYINDAELQNQHTWMGDWRVWELVKPRNLFLFINMALQNLLQWLWQINCVTYNHLSLDYHENIRFDYSKDAVVNVREVHWQNMWLQNWSIISCCAWFYCWKGIPLQINLLPVWLMLHCTYFVQILSILQAYNVPLMCVNIWYLQSWFRQI